MSFVAKGWQHWILVGTALSDDEYGCLISSNDLLNLKQHKKSLNLKRYVLIIYLIVCACVKAQL